MWGTLHIIPASGASVPVHLLGHASKHRLIVLNAPRSIEELRETVGRELEIIPSCGSIIHGGAVVPCVVYCRKGAREANLPANSWANLLWLQALVRKQGFFETDPNMPDHLAGPVCILLGDQVFMRHLMMN
jgi:hypothetical protein